MKKFLPLSLTLSLILVAGLVGHVAYGQNAQQLANQEAAIQTIKDLYSGLETLTKEFDRTDLQKNESTLQQSIGQANKVRNKAADNVAAMLNLRKFNGNNEYEQIWKQYMTRTLDIHDRSDAQVHVVTIMSRVELAGPKAQPTAHQRHELQHCFDLTKNNPNNVLQNFNSEIQTALKNAPPPRDVPPR